MPVTIAALGSDGPPSKISGGYYRFLFPTAATCKRPSTRATISPTVSTARPTSTTSTCSSPSVTTSAPPSPCCNACSSATRPDYPKPTLRQPANQMRWFGASPIPPPSHASTHSPSRPTLLRYAPPKYSTIWETGVSRGEFHTALIWLRMRPQFGPAQLSIRLNAHRRN